MSAALQLTPRKAQPTAPTIKGRRTKSAEVKAPMPVDPIVSAFHSRWRGDTVDAAGKAALDAYLPAMQGTNQGEAVSHRRAFMVADWLVRTVAPTWLDFTMHPTCDLGAALRALPRIAGVADLDTAAPVLARVLDVIDSSCVAADFDVVMDEEDIGQADALLQAAVTELLAEQALFTAANAARGLGADLTNEDLYASAAGQHAAIQSVTDIAFRLAMLEAEGLAAGCAQGARLTKEPLGSEVRRGCRMALAGVHTALKRSAMALFEQLLQAELPSETSSASSPNGAIRCPADVIGEQSSPETCDARGWMALDWLVRDGAANIVDEVPELGSHAAWLGNVAPIAGLQSLEDLRHGLKRAKRDANAVLDNLTAPWRADDEDGLDFLHNGDGDLGPDLWKLYRRATESCGTHAVVTAFQGRVAGFAKTLDLYPWEQGLASMLAAVAEDLEALISTAMHIVMVRALVHPDGNLPHRCEPFGPAGAALMQVEHQVREYYFELHAKLRAVGA